MTRKDITVQALLDKGWQPAVGPEGKPLDMDGIVTRIKKGAEVTIKVNCLIKRKMAFVDGELALLAPASPKELEKQARENREDNYRRSIQAAMEKGIRNQIRKQARQDRYARARSW